MGKILKMTKTKIGRAILDTVPKSVVRYFLEAEIEKLTTTNPVFATILRNLLREGILDKIPIDSDSVIEFLEVLEGDSNESIES